MATAEELEKAESPFKLVSRPIISSYNFELQEDAESIISKVTPTLDVTSKISVGGKTIETFLALQVKATTDSGADAYELAINVYAKFLYSGTNGEAEMDNFSKLNGPAIIYPFLRASLFNMCFAAGIQPVTLPVINFHKFPVHVEKEA